MNKLLELLQLLPKGLANADKVVEGIKNNIELNMGNLPEDQRDEILRRRVICRGCPYFSLNLFEDSSEYEKLYKKPFKSSRKGQSYCGICGCPENTRTASLSSNCGLESYNKQHPENQQELKWKSYSKEEEKK